MINYVFKIYILMILQFSAYNIYSCHRYVFNKRIIYHGVKFHVNFTDTMQFWK